MIQLKAHNDDFELKAGAVRVVLEKNRVVVGELVVDQAGEYEASGVELIFGEHAALLGWERMQMVYLLVGEKPSAFEKGQFSPCDVLIIGGTVQLDKAVLTELLELYDPKLVILRKGTQEESLKETIKTQEMEAVKLSLQALPTEGREIILIP